jgi:hypothetical protein
MNNQATRATFVPMLTCVPATLLEFARNWHTTVPSVAEMDLHPDVLKGVQAARWDELSLVQQLVVVPLIKAHTPVLEIPLHT